MIYSRTKTTFGLFIFFLIPVFEACTDTKDTSHNDNYYKLDFESMEGWTTLYSGFLVKNESHTGNYCLHVTPDLEFSGNFKNMISSMRDWPMPFLDIGTWVKSREPLPGTFLVVALYDTTEKQNKFYELLEFNKFFTKQDRWYHVARRFNLPTDVKDSYEFSIYIWNKSKNDFLMDDVEFELSKS